MTSIASDAANGKDAAQVAAAATKTTLNNPKFRCRFYENEFPELEDIVLVQVLLEEPLCLLPLLVGVHVRGLHVCVCRAGWSRRLARSMSYVTSQELQLAPGR